MIDPNVNQAISDVGKQPTMALTELESASSRPVELHLEGEDDYGLHLRDHRLHINGSDSMLSHVKW